MRRSFPADSASLFPVREFVRNRALGTRLTPQATEDMVLAVSDACALLLRHSLDTVIDLTWESDLHNVVVTVEDRGEIRVWAEEGHILPQEMSLIETLVDEVEISTVTATGGTVIWMHKHLGAPA